MDGENQCKMNIKETRIKAGLTQKQFSEIFEIPIDVIKSWDSGRRKPPEWVEKLIVEKLEGNMENLYSEHYKMACEDIGSNGYSILTREKYRKIIVKTTIIRFVNGFGKILWRDKEGAIVAEHVGTLDDYYPRIGEVFEKEKGQ